MTGGVTGARTAFGSRALPMYYDRNRVRPPFWRRFLVSTRIGEYNISNEIRWLLSADKNYCVYKSRAYTQRERRVTSEYLRNFIRDVFVSVFFFFRFTAPNFSLLSSSRRRRRTSRHQLKQQSVPFYGSSGVRRFFPVQNYWRGASEWVSEWVCEWDGGEQTKNNNNKKKKKGRAESFWWVCVCVFVLMRACVSVLSVRAFLPFVYTNIVISDR